MCILWCFFRLAVDDGEDLFLLVLVHTDGCESLSRAAIRADQRLVVSPREGGNFTVGSAADWADARVPFCFWFHIASHPLASQERFTASRRSDLSKPKSSYPSMQVET
jgi:hypothetical protein